MPGGPETKENTRDERKRQAEHENPAAQRYVLKTRNAWRRQRDKNVAATELQEAWPVLSPEERLEGLHLFPPTEAEDFLLCAELELEPNANATEIHAQILFQVQQYLAPAVRNYTLAEMLARGKSVDEIFVGPALDCGFIDDDELAAVYEYLTHLPGT